MDLSLSGLASGMDWKSVVEQLADIERAPQRRLRTEQSKINQRRDAVSSLVSELQNLKSKADSLSDGSLFSKRSATVSDETIAKTGTTSDTPTGKYTFEFTQLASSSVQKGATNIAKSLYSSDVTSSTGTGPTMSGSNFAVQVTAGTFTVNGQQISITSSDTLQSVFSKIEAAVPTMTASYSAATDKITLTDSSGSVTLGSTSDTSNFLQVARLSSGTSPATSSLELGRLGLSSTLGSNPFDGVTLDNGGSGSFKINGLEISYISTDTIGSLLKKISDSEAGVDASYDSLNDQIILTNRKPGNYAISLEDVGTGNLLAAAKLTTAAGGTLQAGNNIKFKLNGGAEQTGAGNTLTELDHGIVGLSVEALKIPSTTDKTVTVTVAKDSTNLKKAIQDFITQYNKVQTVIENQTKSSTDSNGKVTAGVLAADTTVFEVAQSLRQKVMDAITLSDGSQKRIDFLGYKSGGFDNQITLSDSTAFDKALAESEGTVKELFTISSNGSSTNGIGTRIEEVLEKFVGDKGTLVEHQNTYSQQSSRIDTQITEMEKQVQSTRQRLIDSFLSMETAQAKINQQMQFLSQRFK